MLEEMVSEMSCDSECLQNQDVCEDFDDEETDCECDETSDFPTRENVSNRKQNMHSTSSNRNELETRRMAELRGNI